jgi:hypothetical protein
MSSSSFTPTHRPGAPLCDEFRVEAEGYDLGDPTGARIGLHLR